LITKTNRAYSGTIMYKKFSNHIDITLLSRRAEANRYHGGLLKAPLQRNFIIAYIILIFKRATVGARLASPGWVYNKPRARRGGFQTRPSPHIAALPPSLRSTGKREIRRALQVRSNPVVNAKDTYLRLPALDCFAPIHSTYLTRIGASQRRARRVDGACKRDFNARKQQTQPAPLFFFYPIISNLRTLSTVAVHAQRLQVLNV
jgi:hypothetical protein